MATTDSLNRLVEAAKIAKQNSDSSLEAFVKSQMELERDIERATTAIVDAVTGIIADNPDDYRHEYLLHFDQYSERSNIGDESFLSDAISQAFPIAVEEIKDALYQKGIKANVVSDIQCYGEVMYICINF